MGFEVLWDGLDAVIEKCEAGERFYKDLAKYLAKRADIESKYVDSISSFVGKLTGENEIGFVFPFFLL